ncbi:MAG: hypothetical protein E6J06_06040 [Chloroflexi bacterium]|nr:MAG: hypothetical protein E6J06_06040 [Chloroflexota bacterium]
MLGFRRVLAAAAVAFALVLVASMAVSAAGNQGRTPYPSGGPVDINCGGIPAVASVTFNKEFAKTYTLADGTVKVMIEGRQLAQVTGNGKVLNFNSSGPVAIYFRPDKSVTVVLEGRTFYIAPTLDGMWLYTGKLVVDGTTGLITSHDGHVTDICALLK